MRVPHGDNHDIWLNPNNPQLLIQANDGGAYVSHNGGITWSTQFNQPTAELYQVEVDDQYPYWLYAGQQDNSSTISVPSFPPSAIQYPGVGWIMNTGGCETGPAVPKPGDANIVYSNCKGRFSVFNKVTGTEKSYYVGASNIYGHNPKDLRYRFQRVAPIHVSPHNPDVVYHGSQYLHKTSNDGLVWETISPDLTVFEKDKQVISGSPITRDITGEEYYSTLYSIRESKLTKGLIWTGANDGVISVTRDGGKTWTNVTPKKMPKGGRVESVEPSQFDAGTAYIAVDRHLLGDAKPYVYKTSNYGKSWTLLTENNGIPEDYTTRVLREDPKRRGLLYAGTEYGLFVSFDDGKSWKSFQQNLPVTPITDIKIFRGDLIVSTMGRSFWILDNITALRDSRINNLSDTAVLFKPDNTIRYRYPKVSSNAGAAQYPRTRVLIDYYLPKKTAKVQLDILDANNKIVASIVSDPKMVDKVTEVEDMNLSQTFRYVDRRLGTKAGLNRFAWDLRQKGAWSANKRYRYRRGPMVAPGSYKARLTVNGQSYEQSFEIVMDPRVEASGLSKTDIVNQIAMQQKVIDLLSETRKFQAQLENDKSKKAKKVLSQLKNAIGAYPQQMFSAQVSYLLNMISNADQKPGQEAEKRYLELKQLLVQMKRGVE